MKLLPADGDDAGEIHTLQRAAYVTEAQLYGDPFLPPLTEEVGQTAAALALGQAWKAVDDGRLVGAVRTRVDGEVLHIGRLVVVPDRTGQGIGTALLRHAEAQAPAVVTSFALFTGHLSEANLRLYRNLGYVETRREPLTEVTTIVHLVKRR